MNFWRKPALFLQRAVGSQQKIKNEVCSKKNGRRRKKGKISFYCKVLVISRQGFYKYLENKNKPWKYKELADAMKEIIEEDECNDTYGSIRMHEALSYYKSDKIKIPSERTIYRIMRELGLTKKIKRKPNGLTKADKYARKSDDLIKRNFTANKPFSKCVTDITEVKTKDGKLYVSAIFDCYDSSVLGISIADNMKASLCVKTIENLAKSYPEIRNGIVHSDRGSQYTSSEYRKTLKRFGILQSMNVQVEDVMIMQNVKVCGGG